MFSTVVILTISEHASLLKIHQGRSGFNSEDQMNFSANVF